MRRLRSTSHWSDPRVKPPFGAVEVDWGHSLAKGLEAQWLANELAGNRLHDITRRHHGTFAGTGVGWTTAKPGGVVNLGGAGYVACGTKAVLSGRPMSAMMRLRSNSTPSTTDDVPFSKTNAGTWSQGWVFYWDATPREIRFAVEGYLTNFASAAVAGNDWTQWHTVLGAWESDGTVVAYADGVRGATTDAYTGSITTSHTLALGSDGGTTFALTGQIEMASVWSRAPSESNARWLHAEPYAFLSPIIRRRYFIFTPAAGAPAANIFIQEHFGRGIGRGLLVGR